MAVFAAVQLDGSRIARVHPGHRAHAAAPAGSGRVVRRRRGARCAAQSHRRRRAGRGPRPRWARSL